MAQPGTVVRRSDCLEKARATLAAYATSHQSETPPVRIESIAAWLGFQAVPLYTVGDEFSGLVSIQHKLIGVNGRHHRHRRRFTIGHELAHILLKHPAESRSSPREIALYNAEADICAAELLIPSSLLAMHLAATKEVAMLAEMFDVSEEAMRVRLKSFERPRQMSPGLRAGSSLTASHTK